MLFDKAKHNNFDTSVFEKSTDSIDFFKYLYVDIYDNYFELKNNIYKITRVSPFCPDLKKNQTFTRIKRTDITRIFIAGESVAEFFPSEILKEILKKDTPNKNFEVINAGTGSYESYRIKRITKEILKHEPDYIVIMVGNNDGIFEPVEINYLPYKYKIFRTSYVLNRLSNWFVKRHYFDIESSMPFFKKNVTDIVKYAKGRSKIIFVTLPRSTFRFQESFEDNFPEINYNLNTDEEYNNRREFLKSLPQKYSWIYVADYNFVLKEKVHNYLGYNIFTDDEHYWHNMYWLVSRLVSAQISKKPAKIDTEYVFSQMKENDSAIQKKFTEKNHNNIKIFVKDKHSQCYYVCEKLYINDKKQFKYFIEKAQNNNNKLVICAAIHLLITYGKERQALKYLDIFLRKNPESYKGYLLKALAYYKLGNRELSTKYFDLAKTINPKNNFGLEYLDNFYKKQVKTTNVLS